MPHSTNLGWLSSKVKVRQLSITDILELPVFTTPFLILYIYHRLDAFVRKRSLIINLNMTVTTNHVVSRDQNDTCIDHW